MANKLFELFGTITIRNSDANKAIDDTTQKAQDSETKMSGAFKKIGEAVNQSFKKQPIDNTNNALKGMTETIDKQESDLQKLKDKYVDLYLTHGKNSKEAKACAGEIAGLSNELNYNKNNLDKAKSAADKLDKSLGDTSNTADSSGSKIKAAFEKIGSAAAKVAKVGAVAITAVATGIGAMTSKAVSYYSDYEQLVGGVETLFKDSSAKVVEYANQAYKTAGMSANAYMETVTGFSASLLQSLATGTSASGEAAVQASTDALEEQYSALEKANEQQESLLEEAHDKEIDAYEKLTEQKIALIDKQYEENLKLIDEEKYNKIKAIDDQIAVLDNQTAAEKAAIEKREQQQKKASLQEKIDKAETADAKRQAEQDLADYLDDLAQKQREAKRKEQIAALKDQKTAINEEADAKKAALKEQRDSEVSAVKESSNAQLAELKKAQQKELAALKESNKAKLKELSDYIEKQSAILQSSSSAAVYSAETYAQAAEKANLAMIDMSDNANKMGTSMESIQNAYQGFAKQNFTMLDNLKLGYGGTKEEMERLLSDAQAISGVEYDISSFADIVDAIHVIQTELGITGTTAKEASTTIQGSIGSMKAAFENFLTGMADPSQDFDALLGNLVDSVVTVADNLIPRIAATLPRLVNGLISLIQALVPQIPGILSQLLPAIITGATDLINGIVAVLPQLISILLQSLPALIDGVVRIFNGIIEALPQIVQMLCDALPELIPLLISAAAQMILGLCEALPEIIQAIIDALPSVLTSIVSSLIENLPLLIQGAVQLIIGLVKAFPQIFIVMFKSIPTIVKQLVDSFKKAFPDIAEWFGNKFQGAVDRIKKVFSVVGDFFKGIWSGIKDAFGSVGTWFHDTFSKAWQKVKDVFSKGGEVFNGIKEGIDKTFKKVVNAIIKGINTIISKPFETINNVFSRLKDIKIAGWHPFSWLKEFGVPKIPELELATGTIVDKATPALIGEDGAEAVVPLEKHTEWIDRVADKVVSKMGATRSDSVLAAKIDELINFIKSLKIYLSTGELVGGISDEMNEALGNIAFAAERGR